MKNPKTRSGILTTAGLVKRKLGHKYQESNVDKVWINFVTDRTFKENFVNFCKENGINQSDFFRRCCKKLIEERDDKWI